jgi:hypothetical protein
VLPHDLEQARVSLTGMEDLGRPGEHLPDVLGVGQGDNRDHGSAGAVGHPHSEDVAVLLLQAPHDRRPALHQ